MPASGITQPQKEKKTDFFRFLILAAIIVVVGLGIYFGTRHFTKKSNQNPNHQPVVTTPSQVEGLFSKTTQQDLKNGAYEQYQLNQASLVVQYLGYKDYNNAERVMLDTLKNIPKDKIIPSTYSMIATVEKDKGDTVKYKQYLGLYISTLKKFGQTQQAAVEQKKLDGLK